MILLFLSIPEMHMLQKRVYLLDCFIILNENAENWGVYNNPVFIPEEGFTHANVSVPLHNGKVIVASRREEYLLLTWAM